MSYLLKELLALCENRKNRKKNVSLDSWVKSPDGKLLKIYARKMEGVVVMGAIGYNKEEIRLQEMAAKLSTLRKRPEEIYSTFDGSVIINILAPLGSAKVEPDSEVIAYTRIYYPEKIKWKNDSLLCYEPYGVTLQSTGGTFSLRELMPYAFKR